MLTFDFSALTGPVDTSAVAALRRESIAAKVQPAAIDDLFVLWISLITFVVTAGLVVFVDIPGYLALWAKVAFTALMGSISLIELVGVFYSIYRLLVRWTQFYRAKQFAAANGMTYTVAESHPTWDSLLFNKEAFKSGATNVFTATSEPYYEAGNYFFENWVDKKLIARTWGYAVVHLGRSLPHLVLRSTNRRSLRRFGGASYSRHPVIPLGAFADRNFRLHGPTGAEDEARRLFTPELIAVLRRVDRSVDVEVAGEFMFIYSTRRFAFPRPGAVKKVFAALSLAGRP